METLNPREKEIRRLLVCADHVQNNDLKTYIKKEKVKANCDYCNKKSLVKSVGELADFIYTAILKKYALADDNLPFDNETGEYIGFSLDTSDILYDEMVTDTKDALFQDLLTCLSDVMWTSQNYLDNRKLELDSKWEYFKKLIKHETRFLFYNNNSGADAVSILNTIGDLALKYKLVKKLPKEFEFYRARLSENFCIPDTFPELTTPPKQLINNENRWSPAGVPLYYADLDADTAIGEVVKYGSSYKRYIALAKFKALNPIYILDLRSLITTQGIFHPDYNKEEETLLDFFNDFRRDVTKPSIDNSSSHLEYLPTQVLTEYFRYTFNAKGKKQISGILYHSAHSDKHGICAVMFWDAATSKKWLKLDKTTRYTASWLVDKDEL